MATKIDRGSMNEQSMREAAFTEFGLSVQGKAYRDVNHAGREFFDAGFVAGVASSAKDAGPCIPWDFQPDLVPIWPEPSLASIVHRHYKLHLGEEMAARVTLEYMAALDARTTGEAPPVGSL